MLKIKKELIEAGDGDFIRYTPYLDGFGPCCTGSLSFACWEVALHATEAEHDNAKQLARNNARQVLRQLSEVA